MDCKQEIIYNKIDLVYASESYVSLIYVDLIVQLRLRNSDFILL